MVEGIRTEPGGDPHVADGPIRRCFGIKRSLTGISLMKGKGKNHCLNRKRSEIWIQSILYNIDEEGGDVDEVSPVT